MTQIETSQDTGVYIMMEDNLTVDPVPASNQSMPRKPNYLLLFLILILTIAIVVLTYFVWGLKVQVDNRKQSQEPVREKTNVQVSQSTPSTTPIDETADWKTYQSRASGFELKLPPGWFSHENGFVHFTWPVDNPSTQSTMEGQRAYIDISVAQSDGVSSLEKAEYRTTSPPSGSLKLTDSRVIGGQTAAVLETKERGYRMLIVSYGTLNYEISVGTGISGGQTQSEDERITDKILSTINFIEASPPVPYVDILFCGGMENVLCPTGFNCVSKDSSSNAAGSCKKK